MEPIFGHCGGTGGNVKTAFSCRRNLRFHGLRGSRGPLVQHVLAIETAIVAQIAYLAPKNEENVGPMAPNLAQGSPTESRGGGRRSPFFVVFSTRLPLGGRNGPKNSPKSLRDPSGPQFLMIFTQFLMPFSDVFCRFGAHSWHGGGDWPAGQLDIFDSS